MKEKILNNISEEDKKTSKREVWIRAVKNYDSKTTYKNLDKFYVDVQYFFSKVFLYLMQKIASFQPNQLT